RLPGHEPRSSTDGAHRTGHPGETEWRDWANLTTEIADDVAVRLLSHNVSEYLRFRAVCKPWRELKEDPRAHGVLDSRFRPHGWFPLPNRGEPPSRRRLVHATARARVVRVHHQIFSTSRLLSVASGLLVMRDEATCIVRLLHPFTGALAEFPDITDVRPHDGAEPSARLGMDAFKARFPGLGVDPDAYLATDDYKSGYPAEGTVMDFASIDDSTSPPTLQLCVNNGKWLVISAKPGDEHWVSL
uniref:F-box domain-containing protein n=1 Tax=Triticum urartu TaxID=4572 RepID=A0A8R7V8T6_TRIUA